MNRSIVVAPGGITITSMPWRADWPSTTDVPACAAKALFHHPERVRLLLIHTTCPALPVYVPDATRTVSPATKAGLFSAASMVAQGVDGDAQLLVALPPGATYQIPAIGASAPMAAACGDAGVIAAIPAKANAITAVRTITEAFMSPSSSKASQSQKPDTETSLSWPR
jgi:hypothetical protein